jgi:hypothetical protein
VREASHRYVNSAVGMYLRHDRAAMYSCCTLNDSNFQASDRE